MEELGKKYDNNRLYSDIQSVIHISNNSTFHSKNKNIQLKYHFIRYVLQDELLKLENIYTSKNLVDMLTKVVTIEKLSSFSISVSLQA